MIYAFMSVLAKQAIPFLLLLSLTAAYHFYQQEEGFQPQTLK